ncbi:MAG: ribosomal RNA small subunit methyltransferase A [Blastocatellia bacterium]|nr:MAG: ribosomal RNA small subunit methyltransferase A [Blastocatellia bacterium]
MPLRKTTTKRSQTRSGVRARKRFGQHFLEPVWVDKLIHAIAPQPGDVFLEIGPGQGAMTRPLAARAGWIVAFEIDRDLVAHLRASISPNVTIIEGDFLNVSAQELCAVPGAVAARPCRVVGNLPYNVASPILFHLLSLRTAGIQIADATVMLQREVADRLTALPGSRDYGVLTVLVGLVAGVERVLTLPPGAFRPVPKVRSAVVRLTFHGPTPAPREPRTFQALVRCIFMHRRKTLANALKTFSWGGSYPPTAALAAARLDGRRRPETLTIPELVGLSDIFASRPEA